MGVDCEKGQEAAWVCLYTYNELFICITGWALRIIIFKGDSTNKSVFTINTENYPEIHFYGLARHILSFAVVL